MNDNSKCIRKLAKRLADVELTVAIIHEKLLLLERRLATVLREGVARKPTDASPYAPRCGVPPGPLEPSAIGTGGIAPSEARDVMFAGGYVD